MGEGLAQYRFKFNGSVKVESRPERITSEAGVLLTRDALERLGILRYMQSELRDTRDKRFITHPLKELVATALLLMAQGWKDQDDADVLRDDGALRLAVSRRKGARALIVRSDEERARNKNPMVPDGLASQPTLSRLIRMLGTEENRNVLGEALLRAAARRFRGRRDGHRMRYLTIDVDSLPIEVFGHQPGSKYNGYYHERIYHPLVASCAETGDLLAAKLRPGEVHTAHEALTFIVPLLEKVERELCCVASVRFDAGFPDESTLHGLESRGTPYVARVKDNASLAELAKPYLCCPPGRRPAEPRTWFHELEYKAQSWSRHRRVVLVVQERKNELFPHYFWLITNWTPTQLPAENLLALYRERGTAEGHMGELMNVLAPALSSSPRPKSHYRNKTPAIRYPSGDSFAQNETLLLLNLLAYEVLHALRLSMEEATHTGWSIKRLRERVLRTAARILIHARCVVFVIEERAACLWSSLLRRLRYLRGPEPAS